MNPSPLEYAESLIIGTVEFVSPDEIKASLDIEAPESVALNTGTPRPFPRVNSYVLVPSDEGYLVAQVEWLTVERSPYPKRQGMQDFGLVDLPYPLRKMSLNPLGTLRKDVDAKGEESYHFRRGADTLPSVGDNVLLPTQAQLLAIVESGEKKRVQIGISPLAGNAKVLVDPNRLFGRHLAVLGNTGSGKSCSVAGLIRWSLEQAAEGGSTPNARFIVLDPNGEYSRAFGKDTGCLKPRIFKVDPGDTGTQLRVPLWFWNSAEWCAFTKASDRAQRPILQRALRLRRNSRDAAGGADPAQDLLLYLQGSLSVMRQEIAGNAPFLTGKDGRYWGFIELLGTTKSSLSAFKAKDQDLSETLDPLIDSLTDLVENKCKNERGYNKPFEYGDIDTFRAQLEGVVAAMGGTPQAELPINEDVPVPFAGSDFLVDLDCLATNSGNRQWFDFFIARIRSILADTRMEPIIGDVGNVDLDQWLADYIGANGAANGSVTIIDLSLVPSEIVHVVTAVVARMVFEALQRYRKLHDEHRVLPTVVVMEEAHTFVKRYKEDAENQDAASVCCQVFERIAREGRKFGLGLVISSQRPSELSPTVLSQCNTFLLHRISNDRDQDLVHRFVPDNLKGLLRELPTLPSQNAILLGWASELPVLVRMNDLPRNQQPQSDDPDFWEVWTGKDTDEKPVERSVDWMALADDWQGKTAETDGSGGGENEA